LTYRRSQRRKFTNPAGAPSLWDDAPELDPARPAPATPPPPPAPPAALPSAFPAEPPALTPATRAAANLTALRTLRAVQAAGRPATETQRAAMAAWSGWGAIPEVFDPAAAGWAAACRAELGGLLDAAELDAARRTVLNAHYTDPRVAAIMWDLLAGLGFTGGNVLDPGSGPGLFLGTAPAGAAMTGIELDPVTAAMAALITPAAQVFTGSFAAADFVPGWFDAVIGNVPFGDYSMAETDPVAPGAGRYPIHDHFIVKALHLLRPGGVAVLLTSRHTLDKAGRRARADMAGLADLAGVIRLPEGSHQAAAGTRVVMDLLVFRRRHQAQPGPAGLAFTGTASLDLGGNTLEVNQAIAPGGGGHLLGALTAGTSAHGPVPTVTPAPGHDLAAALTAAAARVTADALAAGLGWEPRNGAPPELPAPRDHTLTEGRITARVAGTFTQVRDGRDEPFAVAASQRAELALLCDLRDTAQAIVDTEAVTTGAVPALEALRARLNTLYDRYRRAHGPLNRFKPRPTGRYDGTCPQCDNEFTVTRASFLPADPDTDPEAACPECGTPAPVTPVMAQARPRQGGFHGTGTTLADPMAPLAYALEIFDPATQHAAKAPIFAGRVLGKRTHPDTAATPADAVAISMDAHGQVILPEVARLLGLDDDTAARAALGELVYEIPPAAPAAFRARTAADAFQPPAPPAGPPPGTLVTAAAYLSGNVRAKLADARNAALTEPRFQVNADALTAVQPRDLGPAEIAVQLGAPWIPATDVEMFLRDLLEDPELQVDHPGGGYWAVAPSRSKGTILAKVTWGTGRRAAWDLAEAMLVQRPIVVKDAVDLPDGGTRVVLNVEETAKAQDQAAKIAERFAGWLWEDPARAARLTRDYNEKFNNLVLRAYDESPLTLPGLASWFGPHPHQYSAVRRIVAEPAALLAHDVGAGKTAAMIMGVMELRRLGLIRTACVVVPNQMLEQFARDWLQLYPAARVLATGPDDLTKVKRRLLRARIATGDWDAVIMTHDGFETIPVSLDAETLYRREEIHYLAGLSGKATGLTVKAIEAAKARAERKLRDRLEYAVDPGLTWEQLGLDYIVYDEAQAGKNLHTASHIRDAVVAGSSRATDMHRKIWQLRGLHDRWATFATATPISNSVTEANVMIRYLRPDLLAAAGIHTFDEWAATFGQVVSQVELAPEGGQSFRLVSRFARFRNVPDLLRMVHTFADVRLADTLGLDIPLIARRPDGKRDPHIVTAEPCAFQEARIQDLGERAQLIRDRVPRQMRKFNREKRIWEDVDDNMLWVSTDGRLAGLDGRAAGGTQDRPGKLAAVAARVAAVRQRHPGKLQAIFLDLSTPRAGWNAYDELARLLAAGGMARERIVFAHDARNDRQRAQMFAACRNGHVDVIIGSTGKMGTGVNIQDILVAMHHVDAPWRPADVIQRNGRGIRQGNTCPEVEIYVYVTAGSFDGFMWQTLERKIRFIRAFMRPDFDLREMGDIGDDVLTYEEIKAVTTGNPLLLEAAQAAQELQALQRAHRAHGQSQATLTYAITQHLAAIGRAREATAALAMLTGRREDTAGDLFRMQVDGIPYGTREDAAAALAAFIAAQAAEHVAGMQAAGEAYSRDGIQAGWLAGFPVMLDLAGYLNLKDARASLRLDGVTRPVDEPTLRASSLAGGAVAPLWVIRGLEGDAADLEVQIARHQQAITIAEMEIAHAREELGAPFPKQLALQAAMIRAADIEARMQALAAPRQEDSVPVAA
jgi:N12 class adenine-specific DNA methylase/SAM-dependent methyltransferase